VELAGKDAGAPGSCRCTVLPHALARFQKQTGFDLSRTFHQTKALGVVVLRLNERVRFHTMKLNLVELWQME